MLHRTCVLFCLLLAFGLCTAEEKKDETGRARITRLIGDLGDRRYDKREAADRALRLIGMPALDALRQATRSTDPEVRRRATRLVRLIEQQAETDRLLAPQRVRLVYKEAALPDAVTDLAKKTGMAIKLEEAERLADRKIT